MVDWAELNHDLLVLVAERIEKIEDFVSFGSVCTSWRAAAAKNNFKGLRLWQHIPCLMLAVRGEDDVVRRFYSLLDNEIVAKVSLPNLKGKKCIESLGWFLSTGNDGKMGLLHPFSGQEIQLPHQSTFPGYDFLEMDPYIFMQKMVLSARPSETSDYALTVICGGCSHLAFWRPGDKSWNRIETRNAAYCDVTCYGGQFYAIDAQGFVVVCNPGGSNPTEGRILTRIASNRSASWSEMLYTDELLHGKEFYIVESSGALLIVTRTAREDTDDGLMIYNTRKFQVFKVDICSGIWEETKSLGSKAVFLGHSATTAVEASKLSGIKANHIYFTDDGWEAYYDSEGGGGKDMGIYSLETGNIERFYPEGELLSKICTSIWVTPKF